MAFCPNSADWGNVADWAAVLVAAAVGYAVWKLSATATRIEQDRHADHLETQKRASAHIAMRVFREVKEAQTALATAREALSLEGAEERYVVDPQYRQFVHSHVMRVEQTDLGQDPEALAKLPGIAGAAAIRAWSTFEIIASRIRSATLSESPEVHHENAKWLLGILPNGVAHFQEAADAVMPSDVGASAH